MPLAALKDSRSCRRRTSGTGADPRDVVPRSTWSVNTTAARRAAPSPSSRPIADANLYLPFVVPGELAAGVAMAHRDRWEAFVAPFYLLPHTPGRQLGVRPHLPPSAWHRTADRHQRPVDCRDRPRLPDAGGDRPTSSTSGGCRISSWRRIERRGGDADVMIRACVPPLASLLTALAVTTGSRRARADAAAVPGRGSVDRRHPRRAARRPRHLPRPGRALPAAHRRLRQERAGGERDRAGESAGAGRGRRRSTRGCKAGGPLGPLHCIPTIVKDNFETAGLQSSNGSLTFEGYVPATDAFQVARIKAAGAIVLAKSNLAEWAFTPNETLSSILPGYTKNPVRARPGHRRIERRHRGRRWPPASAPSASAPTPATRFAGRRRTRRWSASARRWGSPAAPACFRSACWPTSPGRWRARSPTPRRCSRWWSGRTRTMRPRRRRAAAPIPRYADALKRDALRGMRIGVLRQAYERDTTDPEIVQVFMAAVEDLRRAGADDRRSGHGGRARRDPARPRHGRLPGLQVRHQRVPGRAQGSRAGRRPGGDRQGRQVPSDGAAPAGAGRAGARQRPRHAGVHRPRRRTASRCAWRCSG